MAERRGCDVHGTTAVVDCDGCLPTRRHDAWAQWVARLRPWDLTATLTLDPAKRGESWLGAQRDAGGSGRLKWSPRLREDGSIRLADAPMAGDVARSRVRRWLRDGEQLLGRPVAAVVAMEHHKNGWPHFHGLIGVDGGLRGREIAALGTLWHQRNGWNRIEIPRSVGDCAAYAAKYLTKDLDEGGVLIHPANGPLRGLQTAFAVSGRASR